MQLQLSLSNGLHQTAGVCTGVQGFDVSTSSYVWWIAPSEGKHAILLMIEDNHSGCRVVAVDLQLLGQCKGDNREMNKLYSTLNVFEIGND